MMDKLCEPIILGLIFDVIGFLLVFLFGGFDLGRSTLLLQGDHSKEVKPLKIMGAI